MAGIERRGLRGHDFHRQRLVQPQRGLLVLREDRAQPAAHDLRGICAREVRGQQRQVILERQRHHRPVQRPLPAGCAAGLGDQIVGIARSFLAGAVDVGLPFAVELFHCHRRPPASFHRTGQRLEPGRLRRGIVVDLAQQHVLAAGEGGADGLRRRRLRRAAGQHRQRHAEYRRAHHGFAPVGTSWDIWDIWDSGT
ncbi:hypothetical protein D3C86_1541440 [compost metagenome]